MQTLLHTKSLEFIGKTYLKAPFKTLHDGDYVIIHPIKGQGKSKTSFYARVMLDEFTTISGKEIKRILLHDDGVHKKWHGAILTEYWFSRLQFVRRKGEIKYNNCKRLQRKRTEGSILPKGTVCVDRTSKWGNPFWLVGTKIYINIGQKKTELIPSAKLLKIGVCNAEDTVTLFKDMILNPNSHDVEPKIRDRFVWMRMHIKELKGKNLACYCDVDSGCCHADVLLELSNK